MSSKRSLFYRSSTETLHAFFFSLIIDTCPAYFIILDLITQHTAKLKKKKLNNSGTTERHLLQSTVIYNTILKNISQSQQLPYRDTHTTEVEILISAHLH